MAWEAIRLGKLNPLGDDLCGDQRILQLVKAERVRELLQAESYVGDAPERAWKLAEAIRAAINEAV
jgi:hypothetical protein